VAAALAVLSLTVVFKAVADHLAEDYSLVLLGLVLL